MASAKARGEMGWDSEDIVAPEVMYSGVCSFKIVFGGADIPIVNRSIS